MARHFNLDRPQELREAIYLQLVRHAVYPNYLEERAETQGEHPKGRVGTTLWRRTAVMDKPPRDDCSYDSPPQLQRSPLRPNSRAELPSVQVLGVEHGSVGAEAAHVF